MKNLLFIFIFLSIALSCSWFKNEKLPYQNSDLPIEQRVADLISRMTLAEKIRQLDMYPGGEITSDGKLSSQKAENLLGDLGVGSIHDYYPEKASYANEVQKFIIKTGRLGIPALFVEEALHGYGGYGATTFPIPIGMASSFDVELLQQIGAAIAAETRAHNVHMVLSPVLDIAREPRWGRTEETYGEDPYLASELGLAMVKGLQGNDLTTTNSVVAEPKHFGAHSMPEGGTNTAYVSVGEREARSSFLVPFEKAVREGNALGIMAGYHEIDGIPSVSDPWLLTQVLRDEWGFQGFVLSDLGAISRQYINLKTVATPKEAIIESIKAGLDMQFYDFEHDLFEKSITEAVQEGQLSENVLNRAVSNVLRVKFLLGLFEDPYVDSGLIKKVVHSEEHRELAKRAAQESIVLLKNDDNLLPLRDDIRSIAVLGPMADMSLLGGYSPRGATATTVLQAVNKRFGKNAKIMYEPGIPGNTRLAKVNSKFLKTFDGEEGGLTAHYYNNIYGDGEPVIVRNDNDLAPYWHNNSPQPGVLPDSFSVKWRGTITPPESGIYELGIITDDRGRLFFEDRLLVDNWEPFQINVMMTEEVYMEKGKSYPIRIDFAEMVDYAGIQFYWRWVESKDGMVDASLENALKAVRSSDVVILVLGETMDEVGEGRDKQDLNLNRYQQQLLIEVSKTGKSIVMVLMNGRPLIINWAAEHVPAIIEAWYPGEYGGAAIIDVISGDCNPSGKLPITIPRSVGQLPMYYYNRPSTRGRYIDGSSLPLYAFGYGLSYTLFEYVDMNISTKKIRADEPIEVSVQVKNSGNVTGTEIVQLYVNDIVSSVVTPLKTLKAFGRLTLKPDEIGTINFTLDSEAFYLYDRRMQRNVEPGEFEIMVGSSSDKIHFKERVTIYE
ncbi:glycoside hydrolase family 3 C-terminal domain-containing protein [candidate division KSB1 bacterium]|nr:glycoside hydrolase family 3 C-terminal domain-containing protein [candidate division KSB1 bacterium]